MGETMPAPEQNNSLTHAQKILQQLKSNFLNDLPDRDHRIEELILQLGHDSESADIYDDLFRQVHSLKGSAGTFGFHSITKICHHLEDLLSSAHSSQHGFDAECKDICLQYTDLIKQEINKETLSTTPNTDAQFSDLDAVLAVLRGKTLHNKLSGLLVLGTNLMNKICQETLRQLPVHISIADDGFTALGRLLHEKFDFLILGKELEVLNGMALTSALRLADSPNQEIPILMITSKPVSVSDIKTLPDYVINKDQHIADNLNKTVLEIISKHRKNQHRHSTAT